MLEFTSTLRLVHHIGILPTLQFVSCRFLSLLPLFVPFRIYVAREWVLELKRPKVDKEDVNGQKCSSWSPIQETGPQETRRASPIHRRASDIEWEPRHGLIHQDAKIVAKEGAGQA